MKPFELLYPVVHLYKDTVLCTMSLSMSNIVLHSVQGQGRYHTPSQISVNTLQFDTKDHYKDELRERDSSSILKRLENKIMTIITR